MEEFTFLMIEEEFAISFWTTLVTAMLEDINAILISQSTTAIVHGWKIQHEGHFKR